MEIVYRKLSEVTPYGRNPRRNDEAVGKVAESIRQFGFKVPIVIDAEGVIVCGHTRHKAAGVLGMEEVPCIVADDLTPAQISAFRLADNKVAEFSGWDFSALEREIKDLSGLLDMADLGFEEFSVAGVDGLFEYDEDPGEPRAKEGWEDEESENPPDPEILEREELEATEAEPQNRLNEDGTTKIVCPHCGKIIEF